MSAEPVEIASRPAADLVVDAISAPAAALRGGSLEVTYTVRNAGSVAASAPWADRVELIDPTDGRVVRRLEVSERRLDLLADDSYTATITATVPENVASRDYLVGVRTDAFGSVYQAGLEANDLATAEAATAVGRVSLAVQSVEVLTSDPLGGTPIDLAWTVGNIGDGDAPGGRIDAIWLSDDAVLDATDTLIAEAATGGGIAAGSVQDLSGTFLLPENVAGPVFLIVETNADDGLPELGSDSDDTRAVEIDVTAAPTPDLGVAGLVAPDLLYGREVSFDLSWAVENTGVAAAPGATWTERVRLLDPDGDVRRELGSFVRTGVPAPGESVERTERITVEGVSGAFLLEVVVDPDDDVFEAPDIAPNVARRPFEIAERPFADLTVETFAGPGVATSGEALELAWTVRNIGEAAEPLPEQGSAITDSVRLIDAETGELVRGWFFQIAGQIAPGTAYDRVERVTLPAGLEGDYRLELEVNANASATSGAYEHVLTENNTATLDLPVTSAPAPNLVVEGVSGPAEGVEGDVYNVEWTVRNSGAVDADGTWRELVVLIPDDGSSKVLFNGSFDGALASGAALQRRETVRLPLQENAGESLIGPARIEVRIETATSGFASIGPTIYEAPADRDDNTGDIALDVLPFDRPNLRVFDVTAPAEAQAGDVVPVSFEIINSGVAPAEGKRWRDAVFLSASPEPTGIPAGAVFVDNATALAPGERYASGPVDLTLPTSASGAGYIIVWTDAGRDISELSGELDNFIAVPIEVEALPAADLRVSGTRAPSQAVAGAEIGVDFTVTNVGEAATEGGSWTEQVWLTRDRNRPRPATEFGDILLGSTRREGDPLGIDAGYDRSVTVEIPEYLETAVWYVTPWVDPFDEEREVTFSEDLNPDDPFELDANNYKASAPMGVIGQPQPTWDLSIDTFTATEVEGAPRTYDFRAEIVNEGAAEVAAEWGLALRLAGSANGFEDPYHIHIQGGRVSVGLDPVPNRITSAFAEAKPPPHPALAPGERYVFEGRFALGPHARGDHFVLALTEDSDPDLSDNFSVLPADVVQAPAELAVTDVTVPAGGVVGSEVEIAYTVTNVGGTAVWPGTERIFDQVWLSEFSDPDTAPLQRLIATVRHEFASPLAPGESYTETVRYTLPELVEGDYFVHVLTNRFGLSKDTRRELLLHSEVDFALPLTPPPAVVQTGLADVYRDGVYEAAAGNAASARLPVSVVAPNLVISDFVAPDVVAADELFEASFTVTNTGSIAADIERWTDRLVLSLDNVIDRLDTLPVAPDGRDNGVRAIRGPLAPGESYDVTIQARMPVHAAGDLKLLAATDVAHVTRNTFGESSISPFLPSVDVAGFVPSGGYTRFGEVREYANEGDNVALRDITVTPAVLPNLVVELLETPERLTTGEAGDLRLRVTNTGGPMPTDQQPWSTYVFLSRDEVVSPAGDVFLRSISSAPLGAGESVDLAVSFTLRSGIPEGGWRLLVAADRYPDRSGVVVETDETDNTTSRAVVIVAPPPADLAVSDALGPDRAAPGDPVTIGWTSANAGANETPAGWTDAVYLSADGIYDTGDTLLGTYRHGATLAPGEARTVMLDAVLPAVPPGFWRVVVRSDIFNEVPETGDAANDVTISTDVLEVAVDRLTLGTTIPLTLSPGQERLFRVDVPIDQTLRATLAGNGDAPVGEVYLRALSAPTRAAFDAADTARGPGSAVATLPDTEAGTHYVLVRGVEGAPSTVSLTVGLVALSIDDVSADRIGAGRRATITIDGAQFRDGAIVRLTRPGVAQFEPIDREVVDSTRIVATFDLGGAPLGLYDLSVTNPSGARASLPYRVQVERAIEAEVSVGIDGPRVLPAWDTVYDFALSAKNRSNLDAPYVLFQAFAADLGVNDSVRGALRFDPSAGPGDPLAPDTGLPFAELDALGNVGGRHLFSGFMFDLAPGAVGSNAWSLHVYPGVVDPTPFEIRRMPYAGWIGLAATPLTRAEFVEHQGSLALALRDAVLADADAPAALAALAGDAQAWTDLYLAGLEEAGILRPQSADPPVREDPLVVSLLAMLAGSAALGPSGADLVGPDGSARGFFRSLERLYGGDPDVQAAMEALKPTPPEPLPDPVLNAEGIPPQPVEAGWRYEAAARTAFRAVNFFMQPGGTTPQFPELDDDSNALLRALGPAAIGGETPLSLDLRALLVEEGRSTGAAYMTGPDLSQTDGLAPGGRALPFTVGVVNDAVDRSVGELRILSTIDSDLDADSFGLGDILLGDITVDVPDGARFFQRDYDFRQTRGFILRVSAGIDITAAAPTATWLIQAIDPATGEAIRDGSAGVLGPGETAAVDWTVRAAEALVSGGEVTGSARVIMDDRLPEDASITPFSLDVRPPVTTLEVTPLGSGRYTLAWSATDDIGLGHVTLYAAEGGGGYRIIERRNPDPSGQILFEGDPVGSYSFLALATDAVGNREPIPAGATAPEDGAPPSLGLPEDAEGTPEDPPPAAPPVPSTNPLFLQAAEGRPTTLFADIPPSAFEDVAAPFASEAFALGFQRSSGAIGALAVLETLSGEIWVSGGATRGALWRFAGDHDGARAGDPFAVLTEPVYDLAQGSDGRIWAATGGGALLELDPETGGILARHGAELGLAVAVSPTDGRVHVTGKRGVYAFDPDTETFALVTRDEDLRLGSIAFGPTGALWGVTWPARDRVVRIGEDGRADTIHVSEFALDSLAFGRAGTELENLLVVTSNAGPDGGTAGLTLIDPGSGRAAVVALGNLRGDNLTTTSDGRVLVSQGDRVDAVLPVFPPVVEATRPGAGGVAVAPLPFVEVRFDQRMLDADPGVRGSVRDPRLYSLTDPDGNTVNPEFVVWSAEERTAFLAFGEVLNGPHSLEIAAGVANAYRVPMGEAVTVDFEVVVDLSDALSFEIFDTRYDRELGAVSFDVRIVNTSGRTLRLPVLLTLDPETGLGTPVGDPETDADGCYLLDLSAALPDGLLAAGATTEARTVSISAPDRERADFSIGVIGEAGPNAAPVVTSDPPRFASVGTPFAYDVQATDPEGGPLAYTLFEAPAGMSVDQATGAVSWLPSAAADALTDVIVQVTDAAGATTLHRFTLEVENGNLAPAFIDPPADIIARTGQPVSLAVRVSDPEGAALTVYADGLPPGARFDSTTRIFSRTPQPGQEGLYPDLRFSATDGRTTTRLTVPVVVTAGDVAPTLSAPAELSAVEGRPVLLRLDGEGPAGVPLTFSTAAETLPTGATLDSETGVFQWTPFYDHAGEYAVRFSISTPTRTVERTTVVTVAPDNAAPTFVDLDGWQIFEGQAAEIPVFAFDPDNPLYRAPQRTGDGALIESSDVPRSVEVRVVSGLPEGAVFDPEAWEVRWQPGHTDAGTYRVVVEAEDDGDGSGPPLTVRDTLLIEVIDSNVAPGIAPIPNIDVEAGTPRSFVLRAPDPEGSGVTLSLIDDFTFGVPPDWIGFTDNGDGTATLTLAPTPFDRGEVALRLIAEDDGNGDPAESAVSTAVFVVRATAVNVPPRIAPLYDRVALTGAALSLPVAIEDLDGEALDVTVEGLPDGATIRPAGDGLWTIDWRPGTEDAGVHGVTVRARDGGGSGDTPAESAASFALTVRDTNAAPLIGPIGNRTVTLGETLSFTLPAVDIDGDRPFFTATGLPEGAVLDAATGTFSWTPERVQTGRYQVTFSASDGLGTASDTVTLTVEADNQAPRFKPTIDQIVREGREIRLAIGAYDPEGASIRVELIEGPQDALFDTTTGVLSWQAGYDDAGDVQFRFRATDPEGASSILELPVRVSDANRRPVLDLPNGNFVVGEPGTVLPAARDADGDALEFSLVEAPDGVVVDGETGAISWTPAPGQRGDHVLVLGVDDGADTVIRSAVLTVRALPTAPSVRIETTPDFPGLPGQPVVIRPVVDAAEELVSVSVTIDGQTLVPDAQGRLFFVPDAPGRYTALAIARDASGAEGRAEIDVLIRDPADRSAPVVTLDTGPSGGRLSTPLILSGRISDANLRDWRVVLVDRSGRRPTIEIATGTEPVSGTLATLDPADIPDGFYKLAVIARDMGGRRSGTETALEVLSADKAGRVLVETTDASLPLGGAAFDLVRRYDSFALGDSARGLLDQRWSFAGLGMRVETDLGTTGNEALGLFAPVAQGNRAQVILPDGSRAGFTFEAERILAGGVETLRPRWVADDPANGWRLQTADTLLTERAGNYYIAGSGEPYSPVSPNFEGADWTLTGPDGTVYEIEAGRGLTAIRQPGAGAIFVTNGGLVAEDGTFLRFETDTAGRVAAVTGSDGTELVYRTGGDGRLASVRDLATGRTERIGHDAGGPLALRVEAGGTGTAYEGTAEQPVTADLGVLADLPAAAPVADLDEGAAVFTLSLRESELASTASGSVFLRLDATGGTVDTATIGGVTAQATAQTGTRESMIFEVTRSGLLDLRLSGSGQVALSLAPVGDLDGDADVDADDVAAFGSGADLDGDGEADLADRALLNAAFGLRPNGAPVPAADAPVIRTHVELPVEIELDEQFVDLEGDTLFYALRDATGGTLELIDTDTALFTPGAGVAGTASFTLVADDGFASSGPVDITVSISDAPLVSLEFSELDVAFGDPGDVASVSLTADFADEEDVVVPFSWAGATLLDDGIVRLSEDGTLLALGPGTTVLRAGRDGIGAGMAVGVYDAEAGADLITYFAGIDAYPDAVTLLPEGEQRQIVTTLGTREEIFVGKASDGTRYVVGDERVVDVTEDGLITARAEGETTITVLHAYGAEVLRIAVADATPGPTATIDAAGGVVTGPGGVSLGFGPGQFAQAETVTITPIGETDALASAELPEGFDFLNAFEFDHTGTLTDGPAQIAIEMPADAAAPGDDIVFFRRVELPTGPDGALQGYWATIDVGRVDANGVARTTSPPFPGLTERGSVLAARAGFPPKVVTIETAAISEAVGLAILGAGVGAAAGLMFSPAGALIGAAYGVALVGQVLAINAVIDQTFDVVRINQFNLWANKNLQQFELDKELDPSRSREKVVMQPIDTPTPGVIVSDDLDPAVGTGAPRPVIESADVSPDNLLTLSGFLFADDAAEIEQDGSFSTEDLREARIRLRFNGQDVLIHGADFATTKVTAGSGEFAFANTISVEVPGDILIGGASIFVERPIVPGLYGQEEWPEGASYVSSNAVRITNRGGFAFAGSRQSVGGALVPHLDVIETAAIGDEQADRLIDRVPLPDGSGTVVDLISSPDNAAVYVATGQGVEIFDTLRFRFVDTGSSIGGGVTIPGGRVSDIVLSPDGKVLFAAARDKIYRIDLRPNAPGYLRAEAIATLEVNKDLIDLLAELGDPQPIDTSLRSGNISEIELSADGRFLFAVVPPDYQNDRLQARTPGELVILNVDEETFGADAPASGPFYGQRMEIKGGNMLGNDPDNDRATGAVSAAGNLIVQRDPRYVTRTSDPTAMLISVSGDYRDGLKKLTIENDAVDSFAVSLTGVKATIAPNEGEPLEEFKQAFGLSLNRYDVYGYNDLGLTPYDEIGTSRQVWDLDVQTITDVVLLPDESFAFVADGGFRYLPYDQQARIENKSNIGSKIAVIENPLGKGDEPPRFLGSTTPIPRQYLRELALNANGSKLYAAFGNSDNIAVYDVNRLIQAAVGNEARRQTRPLDGEGTGINLQGLDVLGVREIAVQNFVGLSLDPPGPPFVNWGENSEDIVLGFTFDAEFSEQAGQGARIYISSLSRGIGLFPDNAPAHPDADETPALDAYADDYNPGRIFTHPADQLDKVQPGQIWRITADGDLKYVGKQPESNARRTEIILDAAFAEVLTAGQTFAWCVQLGETGERAASLFQTAARPAASTYGPVTVITHGFDLLQSPVDDFYEGRFEQPADVVGLAQLIAGASGGAAILQYDRATGDWRDIETGKFGLDALTPGNSVVLLPDWLAESDISDSGFSEAAADATFAAIMDLARKTGGALLESPFHMIGHDRGAVVNSEIVQRFGVHVPDKTDFHMTTLDPFDGSQETLTVPLKEIIEVGRTLVKIAQGGLVIYGVNSLRTGNFGGARLAKNIFGTLGSVNASMEGYLTAAETLGVKIDPIEFGDFQDPDIQPWSNVAFFDNYFQKAAVEKYTSTPQDISLSTQLILDDIEDNLLPGSIADEIENSLKLPAGPWTLTSNGRSFGTAVPINANLSDTATGFSHDDFTLLASDVDFGVGGVSERVLGWYAGTVNNRISSFLGTPIWRSARQIGQAVPTFGVIPETLVETRYYDEKGWYGARPQGLRGDAFALAGLRNSAAAAGTSTTYIREGTGTGWFYSVGGGGDVWRPAPPGPAPVSPTSDNTEATNNSGAVPTIFNGDFEQGEKQNLINMLFSQFDSGAFLDAVKELNEAEKQYVLADWLKKGVFAYNLLNDGEPVGVPELPPLLAPPEGFSASFDEDISGFGRFPFSYELPGWSFHGGGAARVEILDGYATDFGGLFVVETNVAYVFRQLMSKVAVEVADELVDAAIPSLKAELAFDLLAPTVQTEAARAYKAVLEDLLDPAPSSDPAIRAIENAAAFIDGLLRDSEVKDRVLSRIELPPYLTANEDLSLAKFLQLDDDGLVNPLGVDAIRLYIREAIDYFVARNDFFGGGSDNALLMGGGRILGTMLGRISDFAGEVGLGPLQTLVDALIDRVSSFNDLTHNRFYVPETGANYLTFRTTSPAVLREAGVDVFILEAGVDPATVVDASSDGVLHAEAATFETGIWKSQTHTVTIPDTVKGRMVKLLIRNRDIEIPDGTASVRPSDYGADELTEIESVVTAADPTLADFARDAISHIYLLDDVALSPTLPDTGTAQEALGAGGVAGGTRITLAEARAMAEVAEGLWTESALLGADRFAALDDLTFVVEDLGGSLLALFDDGVIRVDDDAGGLGWFVDPTPDHAEEFDIAGSGPVKNGDPAMGVDLLTVVTHEMGHMLGFADAARADGPERLMTGVLAAGTRRVPSTLDLADLTEGTPVRESAAMTLPSEIVNGGFEDATGWTTRGDVSFENGAALVREGVLAFSGLSQDFMTPADGEKLEFTVSGLTLGRQAGRAPDAFEIALMDLLSGSAAMVLDGLGQTDALLSIQADGRFYSADGVTLNGVSGQGTLTDLAQPLSVSIDLAGMAGRSLQLSADLLGFGTEDAGFSIDDVALAGGSTGGGGTGGGGTGGGTGGGGTGGGPGSGGTGGGLGGGVGSGGGDFVPGDGSDPGVVVGSFADTDATLSNPGFGPVPGGFSLGFGPALDPLQLLGERGLFDARTAVGSSQRPDMAGLVCRVVSSARFDGLVVSAPARVDPGETLTLDIADTGGLQAVQGWRIDWGDGSTPVSGTGPLPLLARSFLGDGVRVLRLTLETAAGETTRDLAIGVGMVAPPYVERTDSADGALVLEFNRQIEPVAALRPGAVTLRTADGRVIPASVSVENNRRSLRIVPAYPLQAGATLLIDGGAQGLVGLLGCPIDGDGDGIAGGDFRAVMGSDGVLRVVSETGDTVSLSGPAHFSALPGRTGGLLRVAVVAETTVILSAGKGAPDLELVQGGATMADDGRVRLAAGAAATLVFAPRGEGPAEVALEAREESAAAESPVEASGADAGSLALLAAAAPALRFTLDRARPRRKITKAGTRIAETFGISGVSALMRLPRHRDRKDR